MMLTNPMDVLTLFPIRRKADQKKAFRDAVQSYATELGYTVNVEENKKDCHNVIIGNPETATYLVTAHYDTPASIGIPNVMIPANTLFFIGYQTLVICVFFFAAFLVGFPVWLLTRDRAMTFLAAYVGYFGVLFLMLLGPANKHNANDNTSGVITLLEIARTLPKAHREKVCFILFDKEEYGLVGSKAYRKAHKELTENKLMLNLDCVGDGDFITLFPSKKVKADKSTMDHLHRIGGWFGQKHIGVHEKSFHFNSDQKNYPMGIGIGAFHKKKYVGLCCGRIHTKKDTILEETNINLLRAAISTLITCDGE